MTRKRKDEGALATLAYVRGWRQTNEGRWFKPGVTGTFGSADEAFNAEERQQARKVRIKKTPNCLHPYTATMKAVGTYGFGNTPAEARASLFRQLRD